MKVGDRVGLSVFGKIVGSGSGGWLIDLDELNEDEIVKYVIPQQQIHIRKDYPMLEIPIGEEISKSMVAE